MSRLALCLLFLILCACDSPDAEKKAPPAEATAAVQPQARIAQPEPAPSPEEIRRADRIIAFNNSAGRYLERGFHSLADDLYRNARVYEKIFHLPKRPDRGRRNAGLLKPEPGLFTEAEAAQMAAGLKGMDKALDELLAQYAELEKYVADKTLRDDGKRGAALVKKIRASHAEFIAGRKLWLAAARDGVLAAENLMLREHPLKRQILAAHAIFREIEQAGRSLASGEADRQLLDACSAHIANALEAATAPPFAGLPGLERLYREFLKKIAQYKDKLDIVISEGAHGAQLRDLAQARAEAASAWNAFAAALNGDSNRN